MTAFDTASMLLGYVWEAACLLLVASIAVAGVSGWLADRRRRRADVEQALRSIGVLGITTSIAADGAVVFHVPEGVPVPDAVHAVVEYHTCETVWSLPAVDGGR